MDNKRQQGTNTRKTWVIGAVEEWTDAETSTTPTHQNSITPFESYDRHLEQRRSFWCSTATGRRSGTDLMVSIRALFAAHESTDRNQHALEALGSAPPSMRRRTSFSFPSLAA